MKAFYLISAVFTCLLWPQKAALSAPPITEDSGSAVILAYHRIGEDSYPATSLRTEQFESHIEELTESSHRIRPLPEIVQAIKNGEKLPAQTITITFEGGYKSILDQAVPLLLKKNIPFTVFYAADQAGGNSSQYLSWQDLEHLQQNPLVTLGILPSAYMRLSGQPQEEILRQLNRARSAHQEHFGTQPKLFSYPFGEHSLAYRNIIENQKFDAAFGLQSGAVHSAADPYTLPRFSMTENYGDIERLRLVSSALPLPVRDIEPEDPYLTTSTKSIGFSVADELKDNLKNMSCFISGQKDVSQEIIGNRVELRAPAPFEDERTRINCTMPGPKTEDGAVQWRWFGMLLINKDTNPQQGELL
ncbi:MAG: hypothetical protein DHS20C02_11210 [Micavibrio sp.]|nr:MAG: hypothetical protein DHS20C02_11210 [Micavibrio sp.]